jgi:hypothetical protein
MSHKTQFKVSLHFIEVAIADGLLNKSKKGL